MSEFDSKITISIQPHVRLIGVAIAVGMLPFAVGLSMYAMNDSSNFTTSLTVIAILGLFAVAIYRWLQIGAIVTQETISITGWINTQVISTEQLAMIREVESESTVIESEGCSQTTKDTFYELLDYQGDRLGTIPGTLVLAHNWADFLILLHSLCELNRKNLTGPSIRSA